MLDGHEGVTKCDRFLEGPYPFKDLEQYLRRIYDAFGAQRLLWGADIRRLTSTYAERLNQFRHGLDFLSAEERMDFGQVSRGGVELAGGTDLNPIAMQDAT